MLGRIIDAIGQDVRVMSFQGGPHAPVEAYVIILGSGYQQKLIEYPLFDSRFFIFMLLSTDCAKFFWDCGPVLHDGIHCEHAEGGRHS